MNLRDVNFTKEIQKVKKVSIILHGKYKTFEQGKKILELMKSWKEFYKVTSHS